METLPQRRWLSNLHSMLLPWKAQIVRSLLRSQYTGLVDTAGETTHTLYRYLFERQTCKSRSTDSYLFSHIEKVLTDVLVVSNLTFLFCFVFLPFLPKPPLEEMTQLWLRLSAPRTSCCIFQYLIFYTSRRLKRFLRSPLDHAPKMTARKWRILPDNGWRGVPCMPLVKS